MSTLIASPLAPRLALLLTLSLPAVATADEPPARPTASAPAPATDWQPYKTKHGIPIERRPVAGSKFFEYRAAITVAQSPPKILEVLWSLVVGPPSGVVKKREVVKRSDGEVVLYDQVRTPVVSDRDYTLRITKVSNPDGRLELRFATANDLGPAPQPKFVRIPAIRGGWLIEPTSGGSRMTYTNFSEPGGSIPAFLIHGAQLDSVVESVERAQETLAKQGK